MKNYKDMTGKKCKCGGKFKETTMLDDRDGVLHCSDCDKEIKRYNTCRFKSF